MTQNTMTQTPEIELRADLDKTVAFLRKKWGSVRKTAALEMIGKSEDEIQAIWDRVARDFGKTSVKYFLQEYCKNTQKSQEV